MSTLAAKITVPARLMKLQPLSHVARSTFCTTGAWYAGNSITKEAGLPAKGFVFFKIMPDTMTANTPIKYAEVAIHAFPLNNAPAINPTMGIFAPQGIKQVVMMVIFLSLSCSMVRDAITPGIPQPVDTSMGMKLLPERPNFLKILSMMKAIRDIYPTSSKMARNTNKMSIWGTNPSTAPTPPTMPSATRLTSQGATAMFCKSVVTPGTIHSPKIVSLVYVVTKSPTEPMDT